MSFIRRLLVLLTPRVIMRLELQHIDRAIATCDQAIALTHEFAMQARQQKSVRMTHRANNLAFVIACRRTMLLTNKLALTAAYELNAPLPADMPTVDEIDSAFHRALAELQ